MKLNFDMQQIFAGINDEAKGMIAKAFMNNGFFETAAPSENHREGEA